jgi:hypothetical protein
VIAIGQSQMRPPRVASIRTLWPKLCSAYQGSDKTHAVAAAITIDGAVAVVTGCPRVDGTLRP